DDAGGEDAGGEDAGGDDAGGEDAGGEDAGGWPGLEDPPGCPDDGGTIGVGGTDVPGNMDWGGLENAVGETAAGDEGEAEAGAGGAAGVEGGGGGARRAPGAAGGWWWPADGARFAPIKARAATAEPATSPPVRTAEASVRETRCRPGRLVPPPGG